jgi:hypothetical protein
VGDARNRLESSSSIAIPAIAPLRLALLIVPRQEPFFGFSRRVRRLRSDSVENCKPVRILFIL